MYLRNNLLILSSLDIYQLDIVQDMIVVWVHAGFYLFLFMFIWWTSATLNIDWNAISPTRTSSAQSHQNISNLPYEERAAHAHNSYLQ